MSVSFLTPGATHSDDFRSGAHCFVLELAPQQFKRVREYLTINDPICRHGGSLGWLTLKLYGEARQKDEASSLAVEGLALGVLAELSRQQVVTSEHKPPRWLEQARELIHGSYRATDARPNSKRGRRSPRLSS